VKIAIVKKIVRGFKVAIKLESDVGKETSFIFTNRKYRI
jgi:hypothetical protein